MKKYAILAKYTSSLVADLEAERSPRTGLVPGGQNNVHFQSLRPYPTHPQSYRLGRSRSDRVPRADRPHGCHLGCWGNPRNLGALDQRLARPSLGETDHAPDLR